MSKMPAAGEYIMLDIPGYFPDWVEENTRDHIFPNGDWLYQITSVKNLNARILVGNKVDIYSVRINDIFWLEEEQFWVVGDQLHERETEREDTESW